MRLTLVDTGFWADVSVETFRDKVRIKSETLSRLMDLGADRVMVGMPLLRADDAEPMLDAVAELIALAA